MRHRARGSDAVELVGEDAGRPSAAAYVGRARAEDRPVRALRAARAELEHDPPLRGADYPVRLCCDQALVVYLQEQVCLDELRLYRRGAHGEDGLARENRRPLRHGPDVPGELEAAQIVEERLGELAARAEVCYVLLAEMQVFDIFHDLLQPGGDREAAVVRHVAVKEVEIRYPVLEPRLEIAVAHRQLIKIAEHRVVRSTCVVHAASKPPKVSLHRIIA